MIVKYVSILQELNPRIIQECFYPEIFGDRFF